VYTFNNISTYHTFHNKLNFKLKVHDRSSRENIDIFLMASNPNIKLGDMYYIRLENDYNTYDRYGRYGRNRKQSCTVIKCTSDRTDNVVIHGELRFGCDRITHNVSTSVNFKLWFNLIFLLLEVMCPGKFII